MSKPDSMACTKCRFFDDHQAKGATATDENGLCRYNPPVTQKDETSHGLWPVVSASDWCGHFTPETAR